MKKPLQVVALSALVVLAGCAGARTASRGFHAEAAQARVFSEMGPHERAITTASAEAQDYFNQGLTWMYAFNHDEAIRSFARAAALDEASAMPWWGIAVCKGPQYNHPVMTKERSAGAWEALQEALARIENTSPVERALIEALSKRYAKPWPKDRQALDEAYANAMAAIWEAHPDDSDVGTLYAESLMVRNPWKLYSVEGVPHEDTGTIVATLERVMEIDPDNPGANHLYIHAVEPSDDPDRGLPAADRLRDMVPASGHLLHMP